MLGTLTLRKTAKTNQSLLSKLGPAQADDDWETTETSGNGKTQRPTGEVKWIEACGRLHTLPEVVEP